MNKPVSIAQSTVFCGIDVSAGSLAVALIGPDQPLAQREFANSGSGHKALIAWLSKRKSMVRVSLEATGIYSLDLALALHAAPDIELAVLNPKLVNRFAQTLIRSQNDASAALVLAEYSQRMPFAAWVAPSGKGLQLRALARHIDSLVAQQTRELNRLHALEGSRTAPRAVVQDIQRALAFQARRIRKMRGAARKTIAADAQLEERFRLLTATPGIGQISAIQLLAETVLLAPGLTVRQWVAHSGLDPAHHDSGTSVHKRTRISRAGNRHLRRALFMHADAVSGALRSTHEDLLPCSSGPP